LGFRRTSFPRGRIARKPSLNVIRFMYKAASPINKKGDAVHRLFSWCV
jgi:hypothetical protein